MPTTTPTFWSGDMLANTSTTGTQSSPRIVALEGGGFAIAWRESNTALDPNGDTSVRVQRFSADGQRLFGEIALNVAGDQELIDLAARNNGGFYVLYTRDDATLDAVARGFSSGGVPLLGGFTEADISSSFGSMTTLTGGQIAAVVSDAVSGLVIKLMSPAGSLIGTFDVATSNDLNAFDPSIAALANGGFAVVWRDTTQDDLQFRLFGADGTPASAQFSVPASVQQFTPEVIGLANGNFVVTWHESSASGFDQSLASVHARIYSPTGSSVSSTFQLNTTTPQSQFHQSITALADGGFFVVWQDNSTTGDDTSNSAIRGQRFSSTGVRIGEEILINEATTGSQGSPEVALLDDGRIVVTWADFSNELDPDGGGVVFRIIDPRDANIFGTNGDDVIYARLGDTVIDGQDGDDALFGMGGDDRLIGGLGNDTLSGSQGDDDLAGGSGGDVLNGGDGDDVLSGGSGDDRLVGGSGNNTIAGGSGDDSIVTGEGIDAIDAGSGNDAVDAGANADRVSGQLGQDRLSGGAGNDVLDGGTDDDRLFGGTGADRIVGGTGGDRLFGEDGNDVLGGGDGNDQLTGGQGVDSLAGGTGNDVYFLDDSGDTGDTVSEAAGEGDDVVWVGFDYTLGENLENLQLRYGDWAGTGNSLGNTIRANGGNNLLRGLAGNDTIYGGTGRDTLVGGDGIDRLFGGIGLDTLTGGTGGDRFIFDAPGELGDRLGDSDLIADFTVAHGDRIVLADIDAMAGTPENEAFAFIGTDAFSGVPGELRYSFADGRTVVEMDTDGDSVADLFLRLEGQIDLTSAAFIL